MMHHFSYDGICVSCDKQSHLNEQHLCVSCFTEATRPFANDNRDDPTRHMSPWGAALFNCFRSSNLAEQLRVLDNLHDALQERLK